MTRGLGTNGKDQDLEGDPDWGDGRMGSEQKGQTKGIPDFCTKQPASQTREGGPGWSHAARTSAAAGCL